MSQGRRFSVTVPDWGQDHLSSEAVAAYVDDELAEGPHSRASRHLVMCPECAAQVVAQRQARSALRAAPAPCLPSSLLSALRSIPQSAELPSAPNGLAVTADGQLVSVLRAMPADPPPAGLAVRPARSGAASFDTASSDTASSDTGRRHVPHRRARLGAGAAVTGLALLAFGAATLPSDTPIHAGDDPGVHGDAPSADAQLRLAPDQP